jgi:hypothetical protein
MEHHGSHSTSSREREGREFILGQTWTQIDDTKLDIMQGSGSMIFVFLFYLRDLT